MKYDQEGHQDELRRIVIAACADAASDEEIARIDELVRTDAAARACVASTLEQIGLLRAHGNPNCVKLPLVIEESLQRNENSTAANEPGFAPAKRIWRRIDRLRPINSKAASKWGSLAAALVIGVAGTIVFQQAYTTIVEPPLSNRPIPAQFVARLVNHTGNLWSDSSMLGTDDRVHDGQSISLSEGFAEFMFDKGTYIRLEGPAALRVGTGDVVSLQHGRLHAIAPTMGGCRLETSLGEIYVSPGAVVGLTLFGSELQIYARKGEITFDSPHLDGKTITLKTGESRRFDIGSNGRFRVLEHTLGPDGFLSEESMSSDELRIPAEYVDAVRRLNPLAYWRFDALQGNRLPSEVGEVPELRRHGTAKLIERGPEESFIEFGIGDHAGFLRTDAPLLKGPVRDYTIELWMKSSYFHTGALVSLVRPRSTTNQIERHGLLLELQGPQTALGRNLSVRFLHRPQLQSDSRAGTNCFSSDTYEVRRWQHLAARREGAALSFFVDGRLVAVGEDEVDIPSDLTLVVGQLYTFEVIRPFVGQLDELAIYDHAVADDQIASHYHLVRPEGPPQNFAPEP